MLGSLAKKIFGSSNDRRVKGYRPRVAQINALEPEIAALSDDALRARTDMLKAELAAGKSVDDILVPPSPRSARPPSGCWASATSTCSSSAAWCCTRAASPR